MNTLLKSHQVIICAGSGGVGKTTVSAALGVLAAQNGLRTLVLTIDPAKRLASALGLGLPTTEVVRVPGQNYSGELFAAVIDTEKGFSDFVRESARDPQTMNRLLANPLYRQLSTTLGGSQEFTSLHSLYQAVASQKYDLVILDTPPAQHAVDFLRAPERIYNLFQSSITKWFMEVPERQSILQKLISRGTQTVLKALEKVTGAEFMSELAEFFQAVRGIQDRISARSIETHRLLMSAQCGFVLVTGFDEAKLNEAVDFHNELHKGGYHLVMAIINRALPLWITHTPSEPKNESSFSQGEELQILHQNFLSYYASRELGYKKLQSSMPPQLPLIRLPEFSIDLVGLSGLEQLAKVISQQEGKDL